MLKCQMPNANCSNAQMLKICSNAKCSMPNAQLLKRSIVQMPNAQCQMLNYTIVKSSNSQTLKKYCPNAQAPNAKCQMPNAQTSNAQNPPPLYCIVLPQVQRHLRSKSTLVTVAVAG